MIFRLLVISFIYCLSVVNTAHAGDGSADNPLRVAIILEDPFGIESNNSYSGIAVDLWEQAASENLWHYVYFEHSPAELPSIVEDLQNKKLDVIIGPIASTANLEAKLDLSRPYYLDYITTIVRLSVWHSILNLIETFLYSAGTLLLVLILFFMIHIHLVWFFEHNKNAGIPSKYLDGIHFVLWATLTRQHYISNPVEHVDFPRSTAVRTSLVIWIAAAYLLTTLISGTVVSFMTVSLSNATTQVQSQEDLMNEVVGTIQDSQEYKEATKLGLKTRQVKNFDQGLLLLEEETIAAMLTSHSAAQYRLQKNMNNKFRIAPLILRYNLYSFAFRQGSPLKDQFNESLVKLQDSGDLGRICKEYIPRNLKNCQL